MARFNSKDYLLISYNMQKIQNSEELIYQVTMVIKSKRNNDEGHLLQIMQTFPDINVDQIE